MRSKELNRRLYEICDGPSLCDDPLDYGYEALGGKPIAYIGWFWRQVNFDSKINLFGVMPPDEEHDCSKVGFMQNNKWGYRYVRADEEQWARIKELLVLAVLNPVKETLEAVDVAIQGLIK